MRKKVCKTAAACFCMATAAFCQPFMSHGAWQVNGFRWQYKPEGSDEALTSVWQQTEDGWYRFDDAGFMVTGWYLDTDGRWYFLNPSSDGTRGKMLTGWQWVDGFCYYLNPEGGKLHPLGAMYAGEKTPDGYEVNRDGAWTDEQGIPVCRPGKGVVTKAGGGSGSASGGNGSGSTGRGGGGGSASGSGGGRSSSGGDASGGGGSASGSSGGGSTSGGGGSASGSGGDGSTSGGGGSASGSSGDESTSVDGGGGSASGSGGDGSASGSGIGGGKEEAPENASSTAGGSLANPGKESDPVGTGDKESSVGSTGQEKAMDQPVSGQPILDQPVSGEPISGQPVSGHPQQPPDDSRGKVDWQVYFTDASTHQLELIPSREGTTDDGDHLTIYFQTQIVDAQGRIWKSLEQSPYVAEINGPQNRILYVEYLQDGEIGQEPKPWQREREILRACMELARQEEAAYLGVLQEEIPDSRLLATDKNSCALRLRSAASRLMPGESRTFYVIGKNYLPEGTALGESYGSSVEYSHTVEQEISVEGDTYTAMRFCVVRKPQEESGTTVWTGSEKRRWKVGDVQERTLGGSTYRFRCIDQDYGDETDRGKEKALFLCDTVIEADTGSQYVYEKLEDGTYGYRFSPGPVVSFGETNAYKTSNIRRWLKESEEGFVGSVRIPTGVTYGYAGSTEPGSGQQLQSHTLKPHYLGSQFMEDQLFILSLDEALKYRQWLWKFEGSEAENPESQYGTFCKSYWLRTPEWSPEESDKVYVVDLVQKNIHPLTVRAQENSEDEELGITTSTGIRPAFVAGQD